MRWRVPPTHGAEGPLSVLPSPYGEAIRRLPSYPDPRRPYDAYGRPSMYPGPAGPSRYTSGYPPLMALALLPGYRGEVAWARLVPGYPKPHPAGEYAPDPIWTYQRLLQRRRGGR